MEHTTQEGPTNVPPIRGVSAEMLRHLQGCRHCPREVVDTIKEQCNRRDQRLDAKKKGNGSSHVTLEEQGMLLNTVANSTADDATTVIHSSMDTPVTRKRKESDMYMYESGHTEKKHRVDSGQGVASDQSMLGHNDGLNSDIMQNWRTQILQLAVASKIPLSSFYSREFLELLHALSPLKLKSDDELLQFIANPKFLHESEVKFARQQLDRVKEGMSNVTIKSGVTLSVTCWRTLDLQHLVAFTLVNSSGDAACVQVTDIGGHTFQLCTCTDDRTESMPLVCPAQMPRFVHLLEDVLADLKDQNINVIAIIADSAAVLSAANQVCRSPTWRSLLVLPCISAILTSLAGTILTHEGYRATVGQLVDIAGYFSNARLQALLRGTSGEQDAHIPFPMRNNWFSFVTCLTKVLHYSDHIMALCSSQDKHGKSGAVPLALRELVLGNNKQLWKTLRGVEVLLTPLREAYSLFFQPQVSLNETNSACDTADEDTSTVHGGLTLAHVMYQLGRLSQQYATLAEPSHFHSSSSVKDETRIVAHVLHELLNVMWQRYDLPTMVLAYVFDFHMDTERLNMRRKTLEWETVSSYFHLYFHRWFCQSQDGEVKDSTVLTPISRERVDEILNTYQLSQFPFDTSTTSDYTDVSSFYSFVSDTHPEICALCCRVYTVALACVDLRRVIRGLGVVPSVAQTVKSPEKVELLLHVGFATNYRKKRHISTSSNNDDKILSELLQVSYPEELLCNVDDWEIFSSEWSQFLAHELTLDELEQLQKNGSIERQQDTNEESVYLSLDQLFFEALPPLHGASYVAGRNSPASVVL
ncbi:hypothetical protein PsorP6_008927 [Peronosclerospora sorghi]|uniref:Uncharacterized protein n=1 Tax=Peronosclerospora sorghi TaxID=230839 RepID=A0ACC0W0Y9_9STRA|nr:hypothetical protein PsorP6_008927 [Peronosclerospora sorghi]